jgi:hypothetical protein
VIEEVDEEEASYGPEFSFYDQRNGPQLLARAHPDRPSAYMETTIVGGVRLTPPTSFAFGTPSRGAKGSTANAGKNTMRVVNVLWRGEWGARG